MHLTAGKERERECAHDSSRLLDYQSAYFMSTGRQLLARRDWNTDC